MKKFNLFKKFAAVAVGMVIAGSAVAQYDYYAQPTWLNVWDLASTLETGSTAITNTPVDLKEFIGVGALYLNTSVGSGATNGGVIFGTGAIQAYTSATGTNAWQPLTNFSLATATQVIYTNYWGTTNSQYTLATNNYFTPGVMSNAVPSVNGFAGQFYVQNPFTNYGAIASGVTNSYVLVGFQINDQQRYLELVLTLTTPTNAVWTESATLVGRRSNPRL
jgi:hypothetical protein